MIFYIVLKNSNDNITILENDKHNSLFIKKDDAKKLIKKSIANIQKVFGDLEQKTNIEEIDDTFNIVYDDDVIITFTICQVNYNF